ncbi:gephyrin-like molybdotransferase Glp [Aliiglaciecola sp. NS0011-25]|uniref:molybdopterin molybdotransferase MoeA n=1 Tax=Aliiglaciecola sp. NS0011-25 TaxID=3127654 RepID=UPI0033424418
MKNSDSTMPNLMPIENALDKMLQQCDTLVEQETISIIGALNRITAEAVFAKLQVPPKNNSAMDGFAFQVDHDLPQGTTLTIQGQALAGQPFDDEVKAGHCIRITTGAILPAGTNTVMMQENVAIHENNIVLNQATKAGNSVRLAGEDIQLGQQVIAAGEKLTPAHMALLASIGEPSVTVLRKPRVAIIATGDELVVPGDKLKNGQIYESNRFALQGLLQQMNVDIIHYGIIEDDPDKIADVLLDASRKADLILSCGGVSVGDADYVKQVLEKVGRIDFWKVAIKPGKPFAFGMVNDAIFCGLPGNPVSSYVTFEKLVTPLLHKLMGRKSVNQFTINATCAAPIFKRAGRADFQRGIAYQDEHGEYWVKPNGSQGSGIMSSIASANCYILLEKEQTNLPTGAKIKIELF